VFERGPRNDEVEGPTIWPLALSLEMFAKVSTSLGDGWCQRQNRHGVEEGVECLSGY